MKKPRRKHNGDGRGSPYPVSRLAPAFELVDLARRIGEADKMLNTRVSSKLKVIADQIKALQEEARSVLEEARRDQDLNHVRCTFRRLPGKVYHLYRKPGNGRYFSMLSPENWGNRPPHEFMGSYRLKADMSWVPAEEADLDDDSHELVHHLLSRRDPDETP